MTKTILALRHTLVEDLGLLEQQFERAGFKIRYAEVGHHALRDESPLDCSIVVVLGGPVCLSQLEHYPCLQEEVRWLRARMLEDLPTLGIALGAQLMASAGGAQDVLPGRRMAWSALHPGRDANRHRFLQPFFNAHTPVLQWQGDRIDLPTGFHDLARTSDGVPAAFGIGRRCLGIQFHPELDVATIEPWLMNQANEIARHVNFNITSFRDFCSRQALLSRQATRVFLRRWLKTIDADVS